MGCRSVKGLLATGLCLIMAACASSPPQTVLPDDAGIIAPGAREECVPFARQLSGIPIYGDAWTWWDQAAGHYARGSRPSPGSVMVLDQYAGPRRAHVAVVRAVTGPREMRVDHANWLDEGQIHLDDPVRDVSAGNDWSEVRVFNLRTKSWGGHTYHVRGFIGPAPAPSRIAAGS